MSIKKVLLMTVLISSGVFAENLNLKYLGTKQPYEYKEIRVAIPRGYKPFFINHLGRHGARHLSSAKYDKSIYELLELAEKDGQLTEKGKELKEKVAEILKIEKGNYGLLTALGVEEEQEIAKRMYEENKEAFGGEIEAVATYVKRAQQSRDAFLKELAKYNPKEKFKVSTNRKDDVELRFFDVNPEYLKYEKEEPWKPEYKKYAQLKNYDSKILEQFFTKEFIEELNSGKIELKSEDGKVILKDSGDAVSNLYDLYTLQADINKDLGIGNYFTTEELSWYEELDNIKDFYEKGPGMNGEDIATEIAKPLLKDFLNSSEEAIKNGNISANLRFAHAETVIPFISLMEIKGMSEKQDNISKVYETWNGSKISPMAVNIQWVFYKNSSGDVIVKILHNEQPVSIPVKTEIAPFYKWEDIKEYYSKKI